MTGNIMIRLYRNGALVGWIANCPAAQGSYYWKTGTYEDPEIQAPVGSGYAIQIRSMDGSVVDFSDATFNIVNPVVTIALTSPNGGESWQRNSFHNITWNSQGITGNIQLILYRNGAVVGWIANRLATSGSYSWKVGTYEDPEQTVPVGSGYSIKIKSWDGVYTDMSDGTFSIY
jgi:hypothetical protein